MVDHPSTNPFRTAENATLSIGFTSYRLIIVAITALIVLAPVSLVFYQGFLTAPFHQPGTQLGFEAYRFVFTDPDFWFAFGTTLILACGMTVIAAPLGTALAFLVVRTDVPGRDWLEAVILVPIFISAVVLAFGYVAALGPRGIVSTAVKDWIGVVPWNLHSFSALILIAGLLHVPHVYFYTAAALRGLGSDVEEAARTVGAGPWRAALDVSFPMVLPAILFAAVLVFLLGFELFGLPLVLGEPQGLLVLSTYLYKLPARLGGPPYHLMAVVAVAIIAIAAPLLFMQRHFLRAAQRFIYRGNGLQGVPIKLRAWGWLAFCAIMLWFVVTAVVPLAGITLRSFVKGWGEGVALTQALTLEHYRELVDSPNAVRSMINTLGMGVIGGAVAVAFYTAVALAAPRRPSAWSRAIDYLVTLSRAMPGLVAGLAMLWVFLFFGSLTPLKETLISVWLAYTVGWLAYGMRIVSGSFLEVAPDLQEAGRSMGASRTRVKFDVTLPLIRYGTLASWLIVFLIFVREYSTGIYLLAPGTEVIGSLLVSVWGTGATGLVCALSFVNVAMIALGVLVAIRFGVRLHG
jgi:iron(III) transport system permease protein